MIKAITLICLSLIANSAKSQDFAINQEAVTVPDGFKLDVYGRSEEAYLHEIWLPGTLFYPNGSTRDYEQIKFNYHENQLEIVVQGGMLNVLANLLTGFLLMEDDNAGHIFRVFPYKDQPTYYELLSIGKYQLLSYVELFQKAQDVEGHATHEIRFEKEVENIEVIEEFFVYNDQKLKPFKLGLKSIVKATGVDKTLADEYIEKNNLDLQERSNLIALFDYFNRL